MENYQILRRIGEGSQAVASLAMDRRTNKQVVIKQLPAGARTRDEMNLRVKHPNIIESIESFVADGFAYFVTKYAEGGDLEKYLMNVKSKQQTIPISQIFSWMGQLCRAVKACHDARIIHRDIKPSNIFLSQDGSRVYLGDFGTAKQFQGAVDVATTFVGSPVCLSPEVISGTPYSFMADVWSLGCVFYEMIALRKPFDTSNFAALVVRICAGKYDPLPPNTPVVLVNAVQGMLTTDANERWMLTDVLSSSEYFREPSVRTVGGGGGGRLGGQPSSSERSNQQAVAAASDYTSADFGDWVHAKLRDVASLENYLAQHRQTDEIVLQRVVQQSANAPAAMGLARQGGSPAAVDAAGLLLNPDRAKRMIPSPRKGGGAQQGDDPRSGFRTPPQRAGDVLFERRPVSEEPQSAAQRQRPPQPQPTAEVLVPKSRKESSPLMQQQQQQQGSLPPPPAPSQLRASPPQHEQPNPILPSPPSQGKQPPPAVAPPAAAAPPPPPPKARQDLKALIREQRQANKANGGPAANNGDVAVEILLPSNLRNLPQNKM